MDGQQPRRSYLTGEFWFLVGSVALAVVLLWFGRHWISAFVPVGAAMFARDKLKAKVSGALNMTNPFTSIDWSNPAASVDTAIRAFVKQNLPQVSAATHPQLAVAVAALEDAAVTTAEEAVKAYALPLILKEVHTVANPFLDSLAAKFPALAPEITAIKAKLPA
jgi:hypothetical protein